MNGIKDLYQELSVAHFVWGSGGCHGRRGRAGRNAPAPGQVTVAARERPPRMADVKESLKRV